MADPPGPGAVTAMREGHDGHHGPPETPGIDTDAVGGGIDLLAPVALVALLAAAVLYLVGLRQTRDRSPWPRPRTAAWMAGLLCAGVGMVGPFAALAHSSFPVHMAGHVLVGMLAPLLLVLGRPVTLALRALPVPRARTLSRVLRSGPIRALTHPVVAGALNVGGLWLLYATPLFPLMHASPWLHAAVHLHVLLTGYLFTASIVGLDPDPHRASVTVRAGVLIVFVAAHSILAKWLWAHPPAGVDVGDARIGAELMFYAGDAVDVLLIVLLLRQWFVATRPRDSAQPQNEESPSWRRSIASTVSGA
ncbi:Putative membrane protein [Microbacterium sp. Nx66]|uniref:cytochrome c oxidase assembly protein n=1 Tax=Microbacterium sp. Nx66 TaxID=2766784 RepID=UPI001860BD25|nr:cytochrome c oxidase assembly protein [Microbacterium sp. Nx66]CAD5141423.1 Putative membrane protein [Microbacterium sp. Nx66]